MKCALFLYVSHGNLNVSHQWLRFKQSVLTCVFTMPDHTKEIKYKCPECNCFKIKRYIDSNKKRLMTAKHPLAVCRNPDHPSKKARTMERKDVCMKEGGYEVTFTDDPGQYESD